MFSLFGHPDVRLLNGGRAKWQAEGRSLTEYFRDRLIPYNAPVSIASNAEFGMEAR